MDHQTEAFQSSNDPIQPCFGVVLALAEHAQVVNINVVVCSCRRVMDTKHASHATAGGRRHMAAFEHFVRVVRNLGLRRPEEDGRSTVLHDCTSAKFRSRRCSQLDCPLTKVE